MNAVAAREIGEAAWTARDLFPELFARRGNRAMLAEAAAAMRAAGLLQREIAAALGVSRSYASELLLDPTGAKARARKDALAGSCERCHGPTSGSDGGPSRFCVRCMAIVQHEERYWTKSRVVEALRAAAEILGRTPTISDLQPSPSILAHLSPERVEQIRAFRRRAVEIGLRLPSNGTIVVEFGSIGEAVRVAGLAPSPRGWSARWDQRNGHAPLGDVDVAALVEETPELDEPLPVPRVTRRDELLAGLRATSERIAASPGPEPTDPAFRRLVEEQLAAADERARATLRDR